MGYAATKGYDLATGLGSVDAYSLAFNWGARPAAGPVVGALSPNPMTASTANQTLTIAGSSFLAGATVTATYPGFSVKLAVISLSATQIQATVNTGTTARTWTITVANPTGPASNPASLSVTAPAVNPAVTSVTPNPLTGVNANQVITINGSGFVSGTGLKVVVGYSGYSATLSGGQIAFVNSSQIQALINVGTTTRTWTVQVIDPSGLASNSASLSVVAPPVIASLTPNPMPRSSSSQTPTINGSGFQTGTGLRVVLSSNGSSTTLQGSAIKSASATQIQATVNVGNNSRTWNVQVVNPNGTASNTATLTVR